MRNVLVPLSVAPGLPVAGSVMHELKGGTMGTSWSARVMLPPGEGGREATLAEELQHSLDEVVAQMSHWEPDSNLSRYNRASAGSWHQLPAAFLEVIGYALAVAGDTGGAYDPCAGALVNLWGFGARKRYDEADFYAPADSAIAAVLAKRDRERVQFDPVGRRILQPGGVQIDLSSVAKGYAVDRLARVLESWNVHHYLVEVGGELRGAGNKPDGQPWWVEIEGVPGADDGPATLLALHGVAVATSGDYRRFFDHGGRRASHTLDPRTGVPIRNSVASVTVIHPQCMAADALSTALSVLGADTGMRFAEQRQLAARFLVRRGAALEEIQSSAWQAMLQ
jgi:thiamine biosynthesis lipoprotein